MNNENSDENSEILSCKAKICPRGCCELELYKWNTSVMMLFCPTCGGWWRHVEQTTGCGLLGTIPRNRAAKETFTMCRPSPSRALQMELFK